MNHNGYNSVELVRMGNADINSVLEILSENKLEAWSFHDFQAEIHRPNSLVFVSKFNAQVIGFCVARLIIQKADPDKTSHNTFINNDDFSREQPSVNSGGLPIGKSEVIESECEIYNIAVKKEFHNQAVGCKILNKLILTAKKYSCQRIWLEVRQSNVKAINFYQKNDFREIYQRKNFYTNPVEIAIVMKRDLIVNRQNN